MSETRVTVYSRVGCHLCDDALAVVERVCADLGERFTVIDIDTDDGPDGALKREFGEQIPVTLVDGRRHDFWRVDEDRLRAALGAR